MRLTVLAILAAAFVAQPAAASAEALDGDAIRSLISDRRVYLSTPYGIELPLDYASNGAVSGDVSGFSLASMFAPRETGQWWVRDNRLCQKWPSWYDGKTACFSLSKASGGRLAWVRDDGLKGTARID